MVTFGEMQKRLEVLTQSRTVVAHLIEYVDGSFRSSGTLPAKQVLLTDKKERVQEGVFEEVITEVLIDRLRLIDEEMSQLQGTVFAPQQESTKAQAAFVAGEQLSTPSSSKKKRAS